MNAQCPACDDGLWERLDNYVTDGEVVADFRCATCRHELSLSV